MIKLDSYRFGFNGKENDNEVKGTGNQIDFGDRIYDPRLGRWLSLDPLAKKYPSMSAYIFVANNPILFLDPDGCVIVVSNKDGQAQTLATLSKAFGENGSNFSFNKKNELTFTGNPNAFNKKEAEVFKGLQKVMDAKRYYRISIGKNNLTDKHGGEYTATITDNPNQGKNIINIDPIESFRSQIGENRVTLYKLKNGTTTSDPEDPNIVRDQYGQPEKGGTKIEPVMASDSKAARFFHGIGHVLFQNKNEQENVIKFDNKARSIFKFRNKNDKYKSAPEPSREVDKNHTNQN